MKITKKQIRRIIREMHPRAAADNAYVADLERREELADQIVTAEKDVYNRKHVHDLEGKTIEELEDILYDLNNSHIVKSLQKMDRDEMEDRMGRDQDLSRAEMAPQRQGMGRRPRGSKSQRRMEIKQRLSKVIKEHMEELGLEEPIFLDFTPAIEDATPGREMGHGGNSRMAKSQLFHIAKNSQSLHDKLQDEDQMPNWAQSKIAVAKNLMDAVYDHLDYKMHKEDYE